MKVLYVVHQFFPNHHTGTERLTLDTAKQVQRMGHFVSVLTFEPDKNSDGFVPIDENIMKNQYEIDSIPVIALKSNLPRLATYVFDPFVEKHLREIVEAFDIVHFTHPMRFASVLKKCKELQIPTVLTLTDNWLLCPRGLLTTDLQLCDGPDKGIKCVSVCKFGKEIFSRYEDAKYFFENVDMVFSGSNFVRWMFKHNDWNREISLNTFSVDYSHVKQITGNKESLVFGFIGSLIWQKGPHVLIEAFKKVESKNIKLKIYGKGVEDDFYSNRVYDLAKKDKRIELCGIFDYNDLPKVMKEISVIVIPSVYLEILPLVMQMTLAYKIPIIASRIGGLPEIIEDGVNGYLFDVGSVDQLSKIISTIANKPEIISELKRGIKLPPRIEEEALIYESAYHKLLKKHKG